MATSERRIYWLLVLFWAGNRSEYTDKVVVKIQDNLLRTVETCMSHLQYVYVDKIIDGIYVFEKLDGIAGELWDEQLQEIKDHCDGKIEEIEQSRYMFPLIPIEANEEDDKLHRDYLMEDCQFLYHETHGISQAWSSGYSGKDVVIGMIDIGFPGIHPDSIYINISLSHDFGEYVGGRHITSMLSNDINKISDETCSFCDVGVAYKADFVDLEIGSMFNITYASATDDDTFARALVYKQSYIDIYVCEWKFNFHLNAIDIAIQSSIQSGVKKGRGGLGSIYVLPSGHAGDGFFNDTFVISVGSVVFNQIHHSDLIINSATLVSAVITESNKARKEGSSCFGPYMATGMIAGMIALTLQENHILSIRDIKQILIQSSTHLGLDFSNEFMPNGAGRFFHPSLGFGYPNASQMIEFAKSWIRLPMQYTYRYKMDNKHGTSSLRFTVVCVNKCVKVIEEVVVQIYNITLKKGFTLTLTSPSDTLSVLHASQVHSAYHWPSTIASRQFMSTHFWGEDSNGVWKLRCSGCGILSAFLIIQGLKGEKVFSQTVPIDSKQQDSGGSSWMTTLIIVFVVTVLPISYVIRSKWNRVTCSFIRLNPMQTSEEMHRLHTCETESIEEVSL